MRYNSKGFAGYLTVGIIQGLAAWSAYALIEFLAASVLFRLGRPYARFTPWHWALTGQLILAYLIAGAGAGGVAGLIVFLLRNTKRFSGRPTALVIEHAATLTLCLAIAIQVAAQPSAPDFWWKLLAIALGLADLLLLALCSEVWSTRLGLLTNPWVVAGLFLSAGQVSTLEFMGVARQLGIPVRPWYFMLGALELLAAVAAAWLGRRWRRAGGLYRIWAPNRAAVGLAIVLMATAFGLGVEPSAPVLPHLQLDRASGTSGHPNVILIVMDTVRADHLSLYGYERDTTPNLKEMASDATVYRQAISAADITLTSHASIFTGLYPSWHGAYCQPPDAAFGRKIGPVPTMAEVFAQSGYRTLGVAGNLYLRADFGLQRGFQQFHIPRPVPVLVAESWYMLRHGMRRAIGLFTDTAQFDRLYSRGDAVNQEFFAMLRDGKLAQPPFFAFLNYMDAHFPYLPPQPFDRLFPGKDGGLTQAGLAAFQRLAGPHGENLSPRYSRHSIAEYDGGIAYMDAQIGQLVAWLKRENLYDNTLIAVTADHGEAFGERGLFGHGNSLYANLLHVGLMVKYPHSAHTGVVDAPVSLIDILPTLAQSAGVEAPRGLPGRDLLGPDAFAARNLFSESFPCPVTHSPECPAGCLMRTVVAWPNKYIFSSTGRAEVYELRQDPKESHNLFGSLNPTAKILATQLNAWIKTIPVQQDSPSAPPRTAPALQGLVRKPAVRMR
jgi:arylsulfatase A-like enzyme